MRNIVMWVERKSETEYTAPAKLIDIHEMDLDDPDVVGIVIHTPKTRLRFDISDSGMDLTDENMQRLAELEEEVERRRGNIRLVKAEKMHCRSEATVE